MATPYADAYRAEFQERKSRMHGQYQDGTEQDEHRIGARFPVFHCYLNAQNGSTSMQNPFQIAMQNGENSAEAVRGALVWRLRVSCRVNSCANGAGPSASFASFWIVVRQKRAPRAPGAVQNGASTAS